MSPLARFTLIRTRVNHRDPGLVFLISTLSVPVRLTRECNSAPDRCELYRQRRHAQPKNKRWRRLKDDAWQNGYLKPDSKALREINFWVGV
jgi:hypothetical protein